MPAHNVVRILGRLPGGEVWSINPRFSFTDTTAGIADYDSLLAWSQAIAGLNTGNLFPTAIRQQLSSAVEVTGVRVEYRTDTGTLLQAAETRYAVPVAGQGGPLHPGQVALVTSLLTGRPGRSFRGRLYWPTLGAVIDGTTLRLTSGTVSGFALAVAGWLSAVQNAAPREDPPELVVVSNMSDSNTPVTQIQVGDVLDTQRRRRDALVENRYTTGFPVV